MDEEGFDEEFDESLDEDLGEPSTKHPTKDVKAKTPERKKSPEGKKKNETRSLRFCVLYRRGQPTRHLFCSFDGS